MKLGTEGTLENGRYARSSSGHHRGGGHPHHDFSE